MGFRTYLGWGAFLLGSTALAGDWPQFRGPDSRGITQESQTPSEWGPEKNIAWKTTVGGVAWSCPIVVGDKIFLTTAVAEGQPKPRAGGGFGGGGRGGAPGKDFRPGGEQGKGGGRPGAGQGKEGFPGGPGGPGGYGRGRGPDKEYTWKVVCLDRNSGKELWSKTVAQGKPKYGTHNSNTFATETPVSDGEKVYAYFGANGVVIAFDLEGKEVWKADLGVFPTQNGWGTASSPALHAGKLFIQCDNEEKSFLVALDAKNGKEIWKSPRQEKTDWSTPYIWKSSKRTDLVVGGTQKLKGYDPETGKELWELAVGGGQSNASPVGDEDLLYFGTGMQGGGGGFGGGRPGGPPGAGGPGGPPGGGGPGAGGPPGGGGGRGGFGGFGGGGTLYAIRAGATGNITLAEGQTSNDYVAWSSPRTAPAAASPLLYEGNLYLFERNGGLVSCLDAKTGKQNYKERLTNAKAFWASPWAANGMVFGIDEDGVTHVIKAGKEFKVIRKNTLEKDLYWSTPALAGGMVFVRGVDQFFGIK